VNKMAKIFLSEYIKPVTAKWMTILILVLLSIVPLQIPALAKYLSWYVSPWTYIISGIGILSAYYVLVSYTK
jgi:hypothetical protein